MTKIKRNKGFTLIELLVVIAIIGILSSIVVASLNTARKKSRDTRRIADIKQIQMALEMYFDSNRSYPLATSDLGAFMSVIPTDPVGAAVAYKYAANPASCTTVAKDCLFYHLGASLEESSNIGLSSDKDCNSSIAGSTCGGGAVYASGFNGILAAKCGDAADATDFCYDIVN